MSSRRIPNRYGFSLLSWVRFLVLAGAVLPACRAGAPRKPAAPVPEARMVFSLQSEDTGTGDTITTREVWSLPGVGQDLRSITVTYAKMGKARTAFQCNNASSFEVRVVYQLQARLDDDGAWRITGEQKRYTPGACDGDIPSFLGVRLHVMGPNVPGRQYLALEQSGKTRLLWAHTPAGSWVWRRVTPVEQDEQKIEYEVWDLEMNADGTIGGTCDRMEIRRSTSDQTFACSRRSDIVLFTRYRLVGRFWPNGQIELRETGFTTQNRHPCDRSEKRYLDTYTGVLMGDGIHLKTRGDDAEQVLTRRHGL